jgi:hypothetical protein
MIEELKELKRQRRVLLPNLRALSEKRHKGWITEDERIELENIEILFDKKGKEITEAKNILVLQNYGFEKFNRWLELWQIKSKPFIYSSDTGKRCKELEIELAEITAFINGIN